MPLNTMPLNNCPHGVALTRGFVVQRTAAAGLSAATAGCRGTAPRSSITGELRPGCQIELAAGFPEFVYLRAGSPPLDPATAPRPPWRPAEPPWSAGGPPAASLTCATSALYSRTPANRCPSAPRQQHR